MEKQETFKFKKIADMSGQEMYCVARLRIDTFVTEQKITEPELDDQDFTAIQVLLLNKEQNRARAVCRIFKENDQWVLGRVAVAAQTRGQHLGTKMMQQVHQYLRDLGVKQLICHAQMQAKPFYDQLGYQTKGEVFTEAGIEHIMMYYNL